MFDAILENYRKATESTMKLQQDMLRSWTAGGRCLAAQSFGLPFMGGPMSGIRPARGVPGSSS